MSLADALADRGESASASEDSNAEEDRSGSANASLNLLRRKEQAPGKTLRAVSSSFVASPATSLASAIQSNEVAVEAPHPQPPRSSSVDTLSTRERPIQSSAVMHGMRVPQRFGGSAGDVFKPAAHPKASSQPILKSFLDGGQAAGKGNGVTAGSTGDGGRAALMTSTDDFDSAFQHSFKKKKSDSKEGEEDEKSDAMQLEKPVPAGGLAAALSGDITPIERKGARSTLQQCSNDGSTRAANKEGDAAQPAASSSLSEGSVRLLGAVKPAAFTPLGVHSASFGKARNSFGTLAFSGLSGGGGGASFLSSPSNLMGGFKKSSGPMSFHSADSIQASLSKATTANFSSLSSPSGAPRPGQESKSQPTLRTSEEMRELQKTSLKAEERSMKGLATALADAEPSADSVTTKSDPMRATSMSSKAMSQFNTESPQRLLGEFLVPLSNVNMAMLPHMVAGDEDKGALFVCDEDYDRVGQLPMQVSSWLSLLIQTGKIRVRGSLRVTSAAQRLERARSNTGPAQRVATSQQVLNRSVSGPVPHSPRGQGSEESEGWVSLRRTRSNTAGIGEISYGVALICFVQKDLFRQKPTSADERTAWGYLARYLQRTIGNGKKTNSILQHSGAGLGKRPGTDLQAIAPNAKRPAQPLSLSNFTPSALSSSGSNTGQAEDLVNRLFTSIKSTSAPAEMESPETMNLTLRTYQKQALAWLVDRERGPKAQTVANDGKSKRHLPPNWMECTTSCGKKYYYNTSTKTTTWEFPLTETQSLDPTKPSVRGGILADEMGMGKTIEMLSLILTNRPSLGLDGSSEMDVDSSTSRAPQRRGTLIVCPLSVLSQWQQEIINHTQQGLLSLYVYHGTNRRRDVAFLSEQDVVLTTFATLATEVPTDRKNTKRTPRTDLGPLLNVRWLRVILDEAHQIKDRGTRTAKAAFKLDAERRWCVTGTPIQNKLDDLFSLLHFLKVEPYDNYSWWNQVIMKPIRNRDERGFRRLQTILQIILLRRTKEQRVNNAPIISLPPRTLYVRRDRFMPAEADFYKALWENAKTKFNSYVEIGTVLHNYAHILELLLRLRQACDHPLLVVNSRSRAPSDVKNIVSTFSRPVDKSTSEAREDSEAQCHVCLDSFEESTEAPQLLPCAHLLCRSCIGDIESEQSTLWEGNKPVQCPTCQTPFKRSQLKPMPQLIAQYSAPKAPTVASGEWQSSTKCEALMEELCRLRAAEPSAKCIVFSQWTSMLDLVEQPLAMCGFCFVRLDGSMPQPQRIQAIQAFESDPRISVFLISMKAGGLGLNLVCASHVFLLDPWWNPATEQQAIDRVHRMGQIRPVTVTRFIIKGSIEERIVQLQDKKRELAKGALARSSSEMRQIRLEELRLLFKD